MRSCSHSLPCGPDGQCVVCLREATSPRPSRAALFGLAVTAALIVGAAAGYRAALGSHGGTEAVAREPRPATVPMQVSFHAEAVPPARRAPSAAPDLTREFQEAFANAWREGLAQAATATAETPIASAGPSVPRASAIPMPVTDVPATTAVADLPVPSATAPPQTAPAIEAPPATPTPDPLVLLAPLTPTTSAATDAGLLDLHVVIYSASWCTACQEAKAWLTEHGIAFEERDIDASAEWLQQLRSLSWRVVIPTFNIDGTVTVGFYPRRLAMQLQRAAQRRGRTLAF